MIRNTLYASAVVIICGLLMALPPPARSQDQNGSGEESGATAVIGWPQVINSGGNTITIYQPQLESWHDNILMARAAVSVLTKAAAQPSYGVVFFTARTSVDAGIVTFDEITINRVNFPREGTADQFTAAIRSSVSSWPRTVALERLQADLAITRAEMKTRQQAAVLNNPPAVFVSTRPAVLVLIDGTPVPRPSGSASLLRIINTRALLLLDKDSGSYYLYLADRWMEARDIAGRWTEAKNPPASLSAALAEARQSTAVDLLDRGYNADSGPLSVFVSTVPAELIVTRGKPDLQPVADTQLLVCTNSDNDVFYSLNDQNYYFLISGRWYRGASLENGPWTFVPGSSLPADFAKIPENNPKGSVLASVPGTTQSREAVISNSIPQTATVNRDAARADVTYDGDPRFDWIVGTPLKYALNSPVPVIMVDDHSFYSVINGVWFAGTSPYGPWIVADYIPAVIYSIPPGNPIHYVVYVKVYGSTPEVVYVGYTPGYFGALVGIDGTVVYGTGYYYYPWVGRVWYGYPLTWGCGVCYGWYGWGWGWGWGPYFIGWRPFFRPWWGPMWGWSPLWWHPWGGVVSLQVTNVYAHWGRSVVVHNNHGAFHGRTIDHNGSAIHSRGPNGSRISGHDSHAGYHRGGSGTAGGRQTTIRGWSQHGGLNRPQGVHPFANWTRARNLGEHHLSGAPRGAFKGGGWGGWHRAGGLRFKK